MHILEQLDPNSSIETKVEYESIRQVANLVLGTQSSAVIAAAIFFALVWSHTEHTLWWSAIGLHIVVFIFRILLFYKIKSIEINKIKPFYVRYLYVVGLVGLSWGLVSILANEKSPTQAEVLGYAVILIYATASTITLSKHLLSLQIFVSGFVAGLVFAFVVRLIFDQEFTFSYEHSLPFCVSITLGFLLLRFGNQLNTSHINALKLQYQNVELLKSTTLERDTALSAIESKNRILACTAHDMRQPVLALDIYTKWLQEDPHLSQDITPKIASATREVLSQFNALFDLAELNQNQTVVKIQSVQLKSLIEEVCMQHHGVALNKGLELRTHLLDATLETDPVLFSRLLGNVIGNAIKYSNKGGILVAIRRYQPKKLQIEVWDTGLGIPDHEQGLVFEAFYKSKAQNGTNDGFGLGLSIVAELARLLGFTVTLRSRVNRGTMVLIDLNANKINPV